MRTREAMIYQQSMALLRQATTNGLIVASAAWTLLNAGPQKGTDEQHAEGRQTDYASQAFYPLTLPLTTGPGTIAIQVEPANRLALAT
jgi:multiple antibiotic resistance protein